MLIWRIVFLILIVSHLIYIDYLFFELLYKKSISSIIAYRKTRLIKLKSSNELKIHLLEEKSSEKYNKEINKLKASNVKIVSQLLDLDNYKVKG